MECTHAMNTCSDILPWFAGSAAVANNFYGKRISCNVARTTHEYMELSREVKNSSTDRGSGYCSIVKLVTEAVTASPVVEYAFVRT